MRSTPGAMPPCGGAPNWNARCNAPNFFTTSSFVYPAISNALYITSTWWLRIAPDESSMPLQTTSYWYASIVSGSLVSRASRPPCGIENGLCEKMIFPVSGSFSKNGKSTIQQNL